MGNSHFKSNVIGFDQTQTITNFLSLSIPTIVCNSLTATSLDFSTVTASKVVATTGDFDTITANTITATTLNTDTLHYNTLTASNFVATTVDIDTMTVNDATATTLIIGTSIRLGTKKYLLFGDYVTEASIVSSLQAVTASPGSLYFGTDLWIMDGSATATTLAIN